MQHEFCRIKVNCELKLVFQMTLMSTGLYNEPAGAYLPSILLFIDPAWDSLLLAKRPALLFHQRDDQSPTESSKEWPILTGAIRANQRHWAALCR